MKPYSEDEWKGATQPPERETRAQAQTRINNDYAAGRIGLMTWRKLGDELSEPELWSAEGKL